ncbi:hypothetical protein HDC91_001783 [Mucilaginibacter sp. AK015]|nr:hypothetical protein [Mucilaginibacter sp. AK015]
MLTMILYSFSAIGYHIVNGNDTRRPLPPLGKVSRLTSVMVQSSEQWT